MSRCASTHGAKASNTDYLLESGLTFRPYGRKRMRWPKRSFNDNRSKQKRHEPQRRGTSLCPGPGKGWSSGTTRPGQRTRRDISSARFICTCHYYSLIFENENDSYVSNGQAWSPLGSTILDRPALNLTSSLRPSRYSSYLASWHPILLVPRWKIRQDFARAGRLQEQDFRFKAAR
jgi:hypothetical protein